MFYDSLQFKTMESGLHSPLRTLYTSARFLGILVFLLNFAILPVDSLI